MFSPSRGERELRLERLSPWWPKLGEGSSEAFLQGGPWLRADGDAEKEGVDAAGPRPIQFMVMGQLHVGTDERVVGAEADAAAEVEPLENVGGRGSSLVGEKG